MNIDTTKCLIVVLTSTFIVGCSSVEKSADYLGIPTQGPEAMNPFEGQALPAEIAHEISELTSAGVILVQERPEPEIIVEPEKRKVQKVPQQVVAKNIEPIEKPAEVLPPKIVSKKIVKPKEVEVKPFLLSKGPLAKGSKKKRKGLLGFRGKVNRSLKGETIYYKVRLGDTLMKIAFEKYGNYLRWREIYKANRNKMKHYTKMRIGTVLTINNVEYVYIRKLGRPYLIRKNDTLKSIAKSVYGTPSRWRDVWKNNPQLIMNPKKIYAGFTLYYLPDEATLRAADKFTGKQTPYR